MSRSIPSLATTPGIALGDAAHLQRGGGHGLRSRLPRARLRSRAIDRRRMAPHHSGRGKRPRGGPATASRTAASGSCGVRCRYRALDRRARVERAVRRSLRSAASISAWISGVISAALSWYGARPMAGGSDAALYGDGAGHERAVGDALDDRLDGVLELLLGAGDDARRRGSAGSTAWSTSTPMPWTSGIADGLEHALAGQTGDLEEHVGALADELLGDRPALGRVIEALGRIRVGLLVEDLDVGLDRLRAVLVAAPVVDDGRDVGAADGADRAASR